MEKTLFTKEEVALVTSTMTLFVLMSGEVDKLDAEHPAFDIVAQWSSDLQNKSGQVDGAQAAKMIPAILEKLIAQTKN